MTDLSPTTTTACPASSEAVRVCSGVGWGGGVKKIRDLQNLPDDQKRQKTLSFSACTPLCVCTCVFVRGKRLDKGTVNKSWGAH